MPRRKWQAIKADTADYKGVVHDGQEFRFDTNGSFVVEDEGIMKEMESVYGKKGTRKLAICPYDDNETQEPGHKYTFGPSRRFSAAWEAFEKRRADVRH